MVLGLVLVVWLGLVLVISVGLIALSSSLRIAKAIGDPIVLPSIYHIERGKIDNHERKHERSHERSHERRYVSVVYSDVWNQCREKMICAVKIMV